MAQRPEDLYQVLQVDPSADPEVIEEAYRRLVRKYHPDFNPGAANAERMVRIHRAYAVLRDPARRAAYDRTRTAGARPWAGTGAGGARAEGPVPPARGAAAPIVVVARCFEVGQEIGVRFVLGQDRVWRAASVLPWSPERSVGYAAGPLRVVQGTFDMAPGYPGCPFCGARSLLQCAGCDNLACWDGRTTRVQGRGRQPYGRCPWCRAAIELRGAAIERLSGQS